MNELEERLQEDLAAAVGAADLDAPALADVMRTVRRAEHRRRVRYAVAVAAVALPLAAVALTQLGGDNDPSRIQNPPAVTDPPAPTSSSTSTTVDTTSTTGSTTTSAQSLSAADVVLSGDGLGVVRFGDRADDVIAALTARLGEPTEDETRPIDPCTEGPCQPDCVASRYARHVAWPQVELNFYGDAVRELVLANWLAPTESPLRTAKGFRVGDDISEWQAGYGDKAHFDQFQGPVLSVRIELPSGDLTGYTTGDGSPKISSLGATAVSGPQGPCDVIDY